MNQLVSKMASEGAAIQPYSKHTMGPLGEEMVAMWDSGSTVEALMTEEAYERWVIIAPDAFEGFVPFDEPEHLEGVDEERKPARINNSQCKNIKLQNKSYVCR